MRKQLAVFSFQFALAVWFALPAWAQTEAPKCSLSKMVTAVTIARQLLHESEPTNAALAEANAQPPVFTPREQLSRQRRVACNLANGLGRDFAEPERWQFLEFINAHRVHGVTEFENCVEFPSTQSLPAIVEQYFGEPDLRLSDAIVTRLCWCQRGDSLLSAKAPGRKPMTPPPRLPARNRQSLLAEFEALATLCGIGK